MDEVVAARGVVDLINPDGEREGAAFVFIAVFIHAKSGGGSNFVKRFIGDRNNFMPARDIQHRLQERRFLTLGEFAGKIVQVRG